MLEWFTKSSFRTSLQFTEEPITEPRTVIFNSINIYSRKNFACLLIKLRFCNEMIFDHILAECTAMFIEFIESYSQWFKATGNITVICTPLMSQTLVFDIVDERKCSNSVHCHVYWINLCCFFRRLNYTLINKEVWWGPIGVSDCCINWEKKFSEVV